MNKHNYNYKKIIFILPQNNFCDEEYHKSRAVFESFGFTCKVASSSLNPALGMNGSFVKPDVKMSNIVIKDYNAMCLIGGVGCTEFWHNKIAHDLVTEAYREKLPLGAICLAPVILANAGLLKGKRATAYPSAESYIKRRGAQYSGEAVEIEKNIVTAKGPEAAEAFALKISKILIGEIVINNNIR